MIRNMTYRVHDFGPMTIGIDPSAKAGCFCPQAFFVLRCYDLNTSWRRIIRLRVTLPHLSFPFAFRWRHFGALSVYRLLGRIYYRMGRSPARKETTR